MNGFLVVVPLLLVAVSPRRGELPPESLRLKEPTPAKAIDLAFQKLSLPCPDRIHQNDFFAGEDLSRFKDNVLLQYRPRDLYEDCADEMDALVRSREAIDGRLLQLADKGRTSPERYRAAWVLIQRRNRRVVPILDKMAASSSAEERYLCWHAYRWAIRERQLEVPKSCEAAMAHCRKEKNPYVQAEIMTFLGACKAKEAVPLLIAGLNNDPEYGAVQALGEIRDPRAVPAILERARKEELNPDIYYRALGQIGTREAVDYLLEHLDEDSSAVEALFESGSPRAFPAIEKHLSHLKKQKQPDDLHLAVAQISVLRLKYKDPRERLIVLAEDQKQSRWMRTHALQALGYYDKKPFSNRILKLYRTAADDGIRMFCIRLLRDLPGDDITEAMIHHALTDTKEEYSVSDYDLVQALNQRLNTSYRTLPPLVEHLKRERAAKKSKREATMSSRFALLPTLALTLPLVAADKPQEAVQLTPEKPFVTVKVGQIVYLGLDDPRPPKSLIRDLVVKRNGVWVELRGGDCRRTGPPGAGWLSFVHRPRKAGTYKVQVKPIYRDRKRKGEWVEFRLTVEK